MSSNTTRIFVGILQGIVMIGLLAALVRNFDWELFFGLISRISLAQYSFWLVLLYFGQLLFVFKWKLALQVIGKRIPFTTLHRHYFIGVFFNNFFPTAFGGDLAKVYYLGQNKGYTSIGFSVLIDRSLGLLFSSAWAAVFIYSLHVIHPILYLVKQVLVACTLVFLAGFLSLLYLPIPITPLKWFPKSIGAVLQTKITNYEQVRASLRVRPLIMLAMALLVLGYYIIVMFIYHDYLSAAEGRAVSMQALFSIVMCIAIFSNLPVTLNGIGLREQLHYLFLGIFQIPKESAVSLSFIVFSQMLIISLLGCIFWIRMKNSKSKFMTEYDILDP